jgi:hypothetical protein
MWMWAFDYNYGSACKCHVVPQVCGMDTIRKRESTVWYLVEIPLIQMSRFSAVRRALFE